MMMQHHKQVGAPGLNHRERATERDGHEPGTQPDQRRPAEVCSTARPRLYAVMASNGTRHSAVGDGRASIHSHDGIQTNPPERPGGLTPPLNQLIKRQRSARMGRQSKILRRSVHSAKQGPTIKRATAPIASAEPFHKRSARPHYQYPRFRALTLGAGGLI
jgi:hypothetical protein